VREILAVGLGGFIGSILRYLVSGWAQTLSASGSFPYGTLAVNVAGCLVLGLLGGLSDSLGVFSPTARALLFIGVLGGFTTFSTFGYETTALARDGQMAAALANVGLSVVLGLAAAWVGYALAMAMR
jgi:CrcB protein